MERHAMPVTRGTSEYSSVGVAKPEQANGTGTKSTIRILVVRYVFDFVSDSRGLGVRRLGLMYFISGTATHYSLLVGYCSRVESKRILYCGLYSVSLDRTDCTGC